MSEEEKYVREAAKITLDKVASWDKLNADTLEEGDEKFLELTRVLWSEFAVSGVLSYDKKTGQRVLRSSTDLDGRVSLSLLGKAGIDVKNLDYVKPGEAKEGAINLDTGDKGGVVYDEETQTAYFDHHEKGFEEVTSTTEIVYKTLVGLGLIERSDVLDKVVEFVTKIDNRLYPKEEFLRSAKTLLGLQRNIRDLEQLIMYFKDHNSPTEELTPEEFEKYGLREAAERQQKIVDEAMAKLTEMEEEGKVVETTLGSVVINRNNELKVGSSAAYVRHDGVINFTDGKSFAVTFKEGELDETTLRKRLGDKFQGKVIRGKMWIYNGEEPLKLTLQDIVEALK